MPIDIEETIERAFGQAFSRTLDQTIQLKAEPFFIKAFRDGSPLSSKLQGKIAQEVQRHIQDKIQWEKKKPGFKK